MEESKRGKEQDSPKLPEQLEDKLDQLVLPQQAAPAAEETNDLFFENYGYRILIALRKISRGISSYSKMLNKKYDITGPQLMCLYAVVRQGPLTLSKLSSSVALSASTVIGILDRLEQKELVQRIRDTRDRRKVMVSATEKGLEFAMQAPLLLHDKLAKEIRCQPELEQATVALALEKIVDMMGVEKGEETVFLGNEKNGAV